MSAFEIEDRTETADDALTTGVPPVSTYFSHPKSANMVACALIGPCQIVHEIFYDGAHGGRAYYYAAGIAVPREVYMDSIHTAERDVYCPGCAEDEADTDALPIADGQTRGVA